MQLVISAGVILLTVGWGILAPESMGSVFSSLLASITVNFGWLYLWVVLGLVLVTAFLAFSRYGDLKLGSEDEEPEFSVLSWLAMLFAAGMGIGLVFWGAAEPVSHYGTPPPGVAPLTPDAAHVAMRYSFFHWGLHPWAVYCVVALAIAFFSFRRNRPSLISSVMEGFSGPWVPYLQAAANILAVIATTFGVAASLGIGALQINSGLNTVFGLAVSTESQIGIIVITTMVFVTSAVSGVGRGIKWLSNLNVALAFLLMLLLLVVGPTVAIIDTFTTTLGAYVSEFVRMSLRTTPFRDNAWVGSWTVFYWAWWIAWSPFVGMFIARVSRGRTIREFIAGTVLVPTLMGFVWFSIFGGTALNLEVWHQQGLSEVAKADVSGVLFAMFDALPLGHLMSVIATVLVFIFFITSGDSATLVLSMMCTGGAENPGARVKLIWGILIAACAASLLLAGGVNAIQTATIVFALPFALVIILMAVALLRAVREDWHADQQRERKLRRRLRELADPEAPHDSSSS